MIIEKASQQEINSLPLILTVNSAGDPLKWVSYERSAYYYAKNKVLWSIGEYEVVLRGGTNTKTGMQSILKMDTIIAVDNPKSTHKFSNKAPILTNRTLFERDKYLCGYCGGVFKRHDLTRDHIIPTSKGGRDVWENVVTACCTCNGWKGARTPQQADMSLLYVPYVPSYHEHLILQNRRILACQMDFLMKGVGKHSRLHAEVN